MPKPKYAKFGCNIPLKKPKHTRSQLIYSNVNELASTGFSNFIPSWDSTDHFHFCCGDCGIMADVLQVMFYPRYAEDGKLYALFVYLGCPKCGTTGFRKIYLKPSSYLGQEAFANNHKLYIFGKEKEAGGILQWEAKKIKTTK